MKGKALRNFLTVHTVISLFFTALICAVIISGKGTPVSLSVVLALLIGYTAAGAMNLVFHIKKGRSE